MDGASPNKQNNLTGCEHGCKEGVDGIKQNKKPSICLEVRLKCYSQIETESHQNLAVIREDDD
jgi:hypothetical protein